MQHCVRLAVVCALMSLLMTGSDAQFSFSLPGKWGNGKRSMGMGKLGECGEPDPSSIISIIEAFHNEALRVSDCLQGGRMENSKRQAMP